jgi:hypothetical protein
LLFFDFLHRSVWCPMCQDGASLGDQSNGGRGCRICGICSLVGHDACRPRYFSNARYQSDDSIAVAVRCSVVASRCTDDSARRRLRQPLAQTPRLVLKRVLQQAEAMGYRVKKGVECEYFLLSAAGDSIFGGLDRSSKPCYD